MTQGTRKTAAAWKIAKRLVSRAVSECSPLGRMTLGCRPGFRILLYHSVGSRLTLDSYGISIPSALFEEHMAILAEGKGVQVVGLCEAHKSNALLRVAVTFDDGYKDNLYSAAPILLKYQVPFTVFVSSSYLKSHSHEYLMMSELRELASLPGVTIGSHGVSHVPLAQSDDSTLWNEVSGSRRCLEEVIGRPVIAIAYPHGSVDLRVREAVRQAGYSLGVCSRFDINGETRDPFFLCRTEIVSTDSRRVFNQKLYGAWDWFRWRSKDPASA